MTETAAEKLWKVRQLLEEFEVQLAEGRKILRGEANVRR
jgi:hypothetical protein